MSTPKQFENLMTNIDKKNTEDCIKEIQAVCDKYGMELIPVLKSNQQALFAAIELKAKPEKAGGSPHTRKS